MFGNQWHKKEKPLPTMIGMGGGATSLQQNAGGGGAIAVRYLILGGGGGGAGVSVGGGGGGQCRTITTYDHGPLAPGTSYSIVVGPGGTAGP